ncbi:MAG: glycosyltransferase family 61 protein [Pedobacter sp.]|nr:MAG: glycosyltransferase family 61 protein [Pedobacter sp.]
MIIGLKNELLWFTKRVIVRFLTKNPFKIKPFNNFLQNKLGVPIDISENIPYVILNEPGLEIKYVPPYFYNEDRRIENYVDNQLRFRYNGLFKAPDRLIYHIQNAFIIGQIGLVYDQPTRTFIEESGKEWIKPLKKSVYLNMLTPPPIKHLDGLTISFLTNGADGGFYHFLFESIVKESLFKDLQIADHYLFNGPPTNWKLKWLDLTAIDQSKIIWVDNKSHFKCTHLEFTNRVVNDQQLSTWTIEAIKKLIPNQVADTKKSNQILWISRKRSPLRNIIWEDQLLSLFPNIIKVDFESMDIDSTITMMRSASHVISPHGAALSNIFLCNEHTKILELYPDNEGYKPCYARLSSICRLEHQIAFINFSNEKDENNGFDFLTKTVSNFIKN